MEPFALQELTEAGKHEQTILLSMDQTDLGNRMALQIVRTCHEITEQLLFSHPITSATSECYFRGGDIYSARSK